MRLSLALLVVAPLALAACADPFAGFGKQPEAAPAAPAAPQPVRAPAVSPLEQPIEVAVLENTATVDAATNAVAMFKAGGTEPYWSAHVGQGRVVYSTPQQKAVSVSVRRIAFAKGVEYIGVMNDRPFAVRVTGGPCNDGMSDRKYDFTAQVTANGRTMKGCAEATTENPPQAPAAKGASKPKAPAKPKTPAKPKPATPAPTTTAPVTPAPTPVTPAPVTPVTPAPVTPVTPPPTTVTPVPGATVTPVPGSSVPAPVTTQPVVVPTSPLVLPSGN